MGAGKVNMKATHIIGGHLRLVEGEMMLGRCCICGGENLLGLPQRKVLRASFMDWEYIQDGDGVCVYCAACLGVGQKQSEWLRYTSFLATPSYLLRLRREQVWEHLVNLPKEPFVFGVTYSHKKHISFKAPVNQPDANPVLVQTENGRVSFFPEKTRDLLQVLQNWYTVSHNTAQLPTYFTKTDILNGCTNYKRIEVYGVDDYFRENAIIAPYRQTALLQLLVYALNKRGH